MKINFKTIKIENFMSIGDAHIELGDRGYTLVSGVNNNPNDSARSNGAGKSSIFEAIVWCLTGDTIRGNKDVVNHNGTDGALVSLEFIAYDKHYVVTRTKEHSIYKTNLLIFVDNEDKSGKGIRDSEKLLKEYLPDLTPSLIGSVIILGQGMPTKFTNNSPSGRKEVLEKLCKSDFMIEDLRLRISNRKTNLQNTLRSAEDGALACNTEIKYVNSLLDSNLKIEEALRDDSYYETLIKGLEEALSGNKEFLNSVNAEQKVLEERLEGLQQQHLQLQQQKDEALVNVDVEYQANLHKYIATRSELSAKQMSLSAEIKKLKNIVDVCPTCGQHLPDVLKPDTTQMERELQSISEEFHTVTTLYNKEMTEYNSAKEKVLFDHTEKMTVLNNGIAEIKRRMSDVSARKNLLLDGIAGQEKHLVEYRFERENLQNKIESCKQKIIEYTEQLESLQKLLDNYNSVIEDTNNRIQVVNKFYTIISRDFRGYLLQSVIEYIQLKAKEYSKDIFGTDLIEFGLDGNNISIAYNNKQYEALSGGERQKVDIIIQFSIRDMLCKYTNFSTNLLTLDEIFDNLDDLGSQKIIDLISTKLSDISSIFIVSHHGNELNIPYDSRLVIIKDGNGVSSIR